MLSDHSFLRLLIAPIASMAVLAYCPQQALAQAVEMWSLDRVMQPGLKPKVEGGIAIEPRCWRSLLVFKSQLGSCTASIIGPRALLTAAHCVGNGASATAMISDQPVDVVKCVHHKHAAAHTAYDFALCELKKPYELGPSEEPFFENVSSDPALVVPGGKIDLLGFGCTTKKTAGGWVVTRERADFGTLYRGVGVDVVCTPSDPTGGPSGGSKCKHLPFLQRPREPVITLVNGKNLAPETGAGGIALCQGDSGGGGYHHDGKSRTLIGVNSRRPDDGTYDSYLASTGAETFTSWARAWSADKGGICGLDPGTKGCRKSGCSD